MTATEGLDFVDDFLLPRLIVGIRAFLGKDYSADISRSSRDGGEEGLSEIGTSRRYEYVSKYGRSEFGMGGEGLRLRLRLGLGLGKVLAGKATAVMAYL